MGVARRCECLNAARLESLQYLEKFEDPLLFLICDDRLTASHLRQVENSHKAQRTAK